MAHDCRARTELRGMQTQQAFTPVTLASMYGRVQHTTTDKINNLHVEIQAGAVGRYVAPLL